MGMEMPIWGSGRLEDSATVQPVFKAVYRSDLRLPVQPAGYHENGFKHRTGPLILPNPGPTGRSGPGLKTLGFWILIRPILEGKTGYFEDQLKGSDKIDFGCFGYALGSRVVIRDTGSCRKGDDCYLFDESPEITELTEWSEANDVDSGSVRSYVVNVVESTGSLA
ncbi:hypothetical protein R6Q59_015444 [Mikania micrantha]